jgi:hypothetical protein
MEKDNACPVDRNGLSPDGCTEEIMALESLGRLVATAGATPVYCALSGADASIALVCILRYRSAAGVR